MEKKLTDRIANTWVDRKLHRVYQALELGAMKFYNESRPLNLVKEIRREDGELLLKPSEMVFVYSVACAQRKTRGDYAEVGVYKGATAKMICEAKGDKHLYLFDTFEGIPDAGDIDKRFSKNQFPADIEQVKRRLRKYKNVHICKGMFPDTAKPMRNRRFAFVHLDVDVYKSTKDCLAFFYKRMEKNGIIISHDYSSSAGVKKAFDEFFEKRPEGIIQLPMSQCMIVKS